MPDNNVPEQEDVIVVGDLAVPARVGAEVAVDVGTVVLESIPIAGLSRCPAMGGGT